MADGNGFSLANTPAVSERDTHQIARAPQRDRVIEAVLAEGATFWPDSDGVAHVTLPTRNDTGPRRFRVASSAFRKVARRLYAASNSHSLPNGRVLPGSMSDSALNEALLALEALAMDEPARETGVRVCRDGERVWLDLGQPNWSLVQVTPKGWQTIEGADVPLLRPVSMRPLPTPMHGADARAALQDLRRLLNLPASDDRALMLCVAWLVAALYPDGPFTVLALDGEQGCGKSTACRTLRRLVDPNKADLRAPPRNEDDLIIGAKQARVIALDNVSAMGADMGDSLCRLATGSALSKRRLFTDGEEYIVEACRPILLNGIPSLLGRGDLADRALAITLPIIQDADRRTESELRQSFDAAAPAILGMLLDGLSLALRTKETLRLPMPRMADFARLACAASPAFGWTAEAMLQAIEQNRAEAVIAVIEADPVAMAVMELVGQGSWHGTGTNLLEALCRLVPEAQQRERGYPKDAARLSSKLKRVAPALRRQGVDISLPTAGGRAGRLITIQVSTMSHKRSERSERSGLDDGAAKS